MLSALYNWCQKLRTPIDLKREAFSFEGTAVTQQYMVLQNIRIKNSKQTSGLEVKIFNGTST
jgi:hypothetical protein